MTHTGKWFSVVFPFVRARQGEFSAKSSGMCCLFHFGLERLSLLPCGTRLHPSNLLYPFSVGANGTNIYSPCSTKFPI